MAKAKERVEITAPNMEIVQFEITGTTPYVQLRFTQKAREQMMADMEMGSKQKKKSKEKPPRDFDEDYKQAMYESYDGWRGIPSTAFRNAMIAACRIVGFVMTQAKLEVFCEQDGFDKTDDTPLVRIIGEPKRFIKEVRNANGNCDLRVRAKFWPWSAVVSVRYDADCFTIEDITNLMHRVGLQVGVGEGRYCSPKSCGQGWGAFSIAKAG
jgi:hypothetical protein|tara:strand:- start:40 stop:672 length:633 start_codon:yes stop_codon:yes gene_type:complete